MMAASSARWLVISKACRESELMGFMPVPIDISMHARLPDSRDGDEWRMCQRARSGKKFAVSCYQSPAAVGHT
jgi:hypothetical protein